MKIAAIADMMWLLIAVQQSIAGMRRVITRLAYDGKKFPGEIDAISPYWYSRDPHSMTNRTQLT